MTAEKLDELARLHAAAGLGTLEVTADCDDGYALVDERGVCHSVMTFPHVAAYHAAIHNAFPAILEYVRGLEGERDELTERMLDVQNERDAAVYVMELEGHATDHGKALLVAHDAQQRREGAADELERLAGEDMELRSMFLTESEMGLRAFSHAKLADELRKAAKRLREGV